MAVAAPPERTPKRKQLDIVVVDTDGNVVAGAIIDVFFDDELLATITSSGRSSIELPDPTTIVRLVAHLGKEQQRLVLTYRDARARFVFDNPPKWLQSTIPGGRCADGTTGQPCVVCQVGTGQVRVCG
jgi:hypothetical protein